MNINKIREDFPILKKRVNGNNLVYFDNGATSQKPLCVINAMVEFYKEHNANIHRGIHKLSEEATEIYERAREKIANFIHAKPNELGFTKNSTEGLNIIVNSSKSLINKDEKIVLTIMEHHANLVPWQRLANNIGCKIEYIYINKDGRIKEGELEKIDRNTKIVSITHASNVLGTINNVKEICKIAKDNGAFCFIDGSQSVPHMNIDVKEIGCDALAFTGHKMLGPMGTGGLFVSESFSDNVKPINYGGDMIIDVDERTSTFKSFPEVIEGGTPNVCGAYGLMKAVEYLKRIGMKNVERHEAMLTKTALDDLTNMKHVEVYGPLDYKDRLGIISFNIKGKHPTDVAYRLNEKGIAVRSGMHCAHPLHKFMGLNGTVRASFYIYNTREEVGYFLDIIRHMG